ncbi:MAG TPA: hypothetical protein ENL03_04295, partial [Phycisphaerae bacterium]|nr:hypothetical protein [Phycisphaerae bacterium]
MNIRMIEFQLAQLADWDTIENYQSTRKNLTGDIETGTWLLLGGGVILLILVSVTIWLIKRKTTKGSPTFAMDKSDRFNKRDTYRYRKPPSQEESSEVVTPSDSRGIKPGFVVRLHLASATRSKAICVSVVENTAKALVAKAVEPLELSLLKIDEDYVGRCNQDGAWWEFKTRTITVADGEIYLAHGRKIRKTDRRKSPRNEGRNRRRYPRVATEVDARIAGFMFLKQNAGPQVGPEFIPARLIQIAGPGLLLETTLSVNASQKVLVVLFFEETKIIEAAGVVRRIDQAESDTVILAVELVGLTNAELKLMIEETEKRKFHGVKTNFPASLSIVDHDYSDRSPGLVVEMTESYIVVETKLQAQIDTTIAVRMHITDSNDIIFHGNIIHMEMEDAPEHHLIMELAGITGQELQNRTNEIM